MTQIQFTGTREEFLAKAREMMTEENNSWEAASERAWQFVKGSLLERGREKGYAGVWGDGFRQGWQAKDSNTDVNLKPLEWSEVTSSREDGDPEPTGDFEASDYVGGFYYIRCYFGSDSYGWEVTWGEAFVADRDNPDDAMLAASAHHRSNILAALQTPHKAKTP